VRGLPSGKVTVISDNAAGAAAALAAFVIAESRSAQPLLPLWIFADRNRAGVYLILVCLASTFFGMFFFLTQFTQVVWGYSALRGGLAYLPFVGGFIVVAGICTRLVSRVGARVPMTIGALLAPAGMFWLSRVHETSHYLTGVCLPLLVFAGAAGMIFVPLTMTLVSGISDEHAGVASSMFNAGQQVGGAVGLAVIGSVTWTLVNNRVRSAVARASALHASAGHRAMPVGRIYDHALATGVGAALEIGDGVGERWLGLGEPQPDFLTESDVVLFGGGFELAPEAFVNPQIYLDDCVQLARLTRAHVTLLGTARDGIA